MGKILFFVSEDVMTKFTRDVLAPRHPDISIETAYSHEAVKLVPELIAQGVDVIAARAGTAMAIKHAHSNISVVEIPITGFDIIQAVHEDQLFGKNIAFLTYSESVLGIDSLSGLLGTRIWQYTIAFGESFEKAVLEAHTDGADVIMGGVRVVEMAKSHGIPASLIKVGKESLLQAARETEQILQALEIEAAKRGFFKSIIDFANDGIITIDKDHKITAFNPAAQNITKISDTRALGQKVEKILPQLQLGDLSVNKQDNMQRITDINGTRIMFNKVPIIVNGKQFGAVATFQEIGKIQQMEAKIRQEIYSRGHLARFVFKDVVGKSAKITAVVETAKDFAATNFTILITGETGTGKEVFAQSIHNQSTRAKGPFVALNCAALPSNILEGELFGYVAGAFTGASKEGKAGLFEIAHGGTIFLDEISEMDYTNQGRLLRVLQERTVVRLGSHKVLPIDVRVIAATNRNLGQLIQENKFRDDLYYRLNVLSLELPPLRSRKKDIHLFIDAFLNEFSVDSKKLFSISSDAKRLLEEYSWPGNIRELRNIMQRISATLKTDLISSSALTGIFKHKNTAVYTPSPKEDRLTKEIKDALAKTRGNCTAAAQLLGIHRMTLHRRMQKLNIDEY